MPTAEGRQDLFLPQSRALESKRRPQTRELQDRSSPARGSQPPRSSGLGKTCIDPQGRSGGYRSEAKARGSALTHSLGRHPPRPPVSPHTCSLPWRSEVWTGLSHPGAQVKYKNPVRGSTRLWTVTMAEATWGPVNQSDSDHQPSPAPAFYRERNRDP